MADALPKISVIIVSWNVKGHLRENLRALFQLPDEPPFEVFVVDNASTDGSAAMVREEFPQVRLIVNADNRGFAAANNQALREVRGEVVLLLNPDMLVAPGALSEAHDLLMREREVGVLGLRLLAADGSVFRSVRRFPDIWSQLSLVLKLARLFPGGQRHYLAADFDYSRDQDVDQVRGSFFAFRRGLLLTVGFLDEKNFFIWFEEVDFCRRVRAAGLKVRYHARLGARDLSGRSFAQVRHLTNQRRLTRSLINYFRKWGQPWEVVLLLMARPVGLLGAGVADLVNYREKPSNV